VTWEICGGDVGDSFGVDIDDLENISMNNEIKFMLVRLAYPPAIKLRLRWDERCHNACIMRGYGSVDNMEGKREKSSLENRQNVCRSKAEREAIYCALSDVADSVGRPAVGFHLRWEWSLAWVRNRWVPKTNQRRRDDQKL
jgi:hypothetical protein